MPVVNPHSPSRFPKEQDFKKIGRIDFAAVIIILQSTSYVSIDKEVNTTLSLVEFYILYVGFYAFHRSYIFFLQLKIASELEAHVGAAGAQWRSHQDSPQR